MGSHIPKENMIPLGKDPEHDAKVRMKLKGSGSMKRVSAQRLRRLKEIENPDDFEKKCLKMLSDPKMIETTILEILEEVRSRNDITPKLKLELSKAYGDAHRTIFGTKSTNLNLNINKTDSSASMQKIYEVVCGKKKNENKKDSGDD